MPLDGIPLQQPTGRPGPREVLEYLIPLLTFLPTMVAQAHPGNGWGQLVEEHDHLRVLSAHGGELWRRIPTETEHLARKEG